MAPAQEEEGYSKQSDNEVDAGRDRATPASVRRDDDESLTPEEDLFVVNG